MPSFVCPAKQRKRKAGGNKRFYLLAVPVIFILDRISKNYTLNHYVEGGGSAVIPGVFYLTRVNNTGAAFGMLRNHGSFLMLVSFFFVMVFLIYPVASFFFHKKNKEFFLKSKDGRVYLGWLFIIAGALSNLYDRLVYGYVVDFLDFRFWPVFNIGDMSICLGVFLVGLSFFIGKEKKI